MVMNKEFNGRLTAESYAEFSRKFSAGEFGNCRLGQAFINTFGQMQSLGHMHDFYYEKDDNKAQLHIDQILIDYQI